jgi:hypothetical protein
MTCQTPQNQASAEDLKEVHNLNRDVLPIRSVMWRQISLICVPQLMSVGGPLAAQIN